MKLFHATDGFVNLNCMRSIKIEQYLDGWRLELILVDNSVHISNMKWDGELEAEQYLRALFPQM